MSVIANIDPNLGFAKTRVAVTLMMWDYRARLEVVVTGNVTGFDLFDAALSRLADNAVRSDGLVVLLSRPSQVAGVSDDEILEVDLADEGRDPEDNLKDLVVAIEIVGQEALSTASPAVVS